ncbi:hypothetical protein H6802_00090, partial [Candidatus Nomurabacteria bacterium]|nr:hypothetical protein [Candidatus Nomurabacteria bacterium]
YPFGMNHDGPWYATVAPENKYLYNGIEKNEDYGANVNLTRFRTYDPAIGRWMQIDPLSEVAYSWSPFRFGFDNPLYYSDPLGLFETRREARKYRRENDIKGKVVKQRDGTFAIENKNAHTSIFNDPEFGIMTAVMISGKRGKINNQQTSFIEQTGSASSFASSVLGTTGGLIHSGKYDVDVWVGKNLKFNSVSVSPGRIRPFYGNQYTGSVNSAKALARPLKIAGTAIGVYNYASIATSYENGNLSEGQLMGEAGANTISTFFGIKGIAFGVGWELGRIVTQTQGYQNWKRDKWMPFMQKHLSEEPKLLSE